jgi:DNA-binding MarR family transcriptional regulator
MSKQSQQALDLSETMLIALRRVIRAVDLHSRSLVQSHGLTGPQSLLLRATIAAGGPTPGELARRLSLSQATVTDIVKRLEARGLLRRRRDEVDRRRVVVTATAEGEALNRSAPPLLQEKFVRRFESLRDWEQTLLVASLQRIAELMDAEDLDAAPMLTSGAVAAPAETYATATVEKEESGD